MLRAEGRRLSFRVQSAAADPLYGSSPLITKEGEVLLLAGADTSWLLRAKLKDLLALCEKD